jgi:dihydropteroate synthase
VLMHMLGDPKTMQDAPHYEDVVAEVVGHLKARADAAIEAGVSREKIWLDPGIGFAKAAAHNLSLTRHLDQLVDLGFPVLYAASRKRIVQAVDASASDPLDRLGGSLALALEGVRRGAAMVRVHDVRETVQALKLQAAVAGA